MSIFIFGKGDRIALPHLYPSRTSFGSSTSYTKPSYKWCYSEYGMVIPTTYDGVQYNTVMDGKLPKSSKNIPLFELGLKFIIIDHNGAIWNSSLSLFNKDSSVHHESIINDENTWWINQKCYSGNKDIDLLLGFLFTDPTEEEIDKFYFEKFLGEKLIWRSISDIVAELNKDFPVSTDTDVTDTNSS